MRNATVKFVTRVFEPARPCRQLRSNLKETEGSVWRSNVGSTDQANFILSSRNDLSSGVPVFFPISNLARRDPATKRGGKTKEGKSTIRRAAPTGIYICTSLWQLNYLCRVIEATRERIGIVFSRRYIPLLCRKEPAKGGNGVVVVTRFNRLRERIRTAT